MSCPNAKCTPSVLIFVYGTLKRGGANDINQYVGRVSFVGEGFAFGQLYDLGHCPALVIGKGGPVTKVWGEIYKIERSLFEELDRWEAQCGDFQLQEVDVQTSNGVLQCVVYEVGPGQLNCDCPIENGLWQASHTLFAHQLLPVADNAIEVDFSHVADAVRLQFIAGWARAVRRAGIAGIHDVVEAPRSVTVFYRPELMWSPQSPDPLANLAKRLLQIAFTPAKLGGREHCIPVCYEVPFAIDLADLAARKQCTAEQIINGHLGALYRVASLGFLPGFAYLTGLPSDLHVARKDVPSLSVPASSVALADEYTGIYPQASPGGWHIIGRTPLKMFDVCRDEPSLLVLGDSVRFERIGVDEFARRSSC